MERNDLKKLVALRPEFPLPWVITELKDGFRISLGAGKYIQTNDLRVAEFLLLTHKFSWMLDARFNPALDNVPAQKEKSP